MKKNKTFKMKFQSICNLSIKKKTDTKTKTAIKNTKNLRIVFFFSIFEKICTE